MSQPAAHPVLALARKELRQLLPLMVGLAAILIWVGASSLLLDPPDQESWASLSWLADPRLGRVSAWITLFLGVITAYNLLPGEHDQRTIEFLYTLPVRRRTVFLVKYVVGSTLLVAFGVLGTLMGWFQHSLNAGSFEQHQLRPRFMLLELGADLLLPFICVAYGLVLAYFRRLGWVLGLVIWLALELGEQLDPALGLLNVKSLLEVEHHGSEPLVRWSAWQLHVPLAMAALFWAGRLWLGREEAFVAFYRRLTDSQRLRRLGVALGLGALALVAIPLMLGLETAEDEPADQPVLSVETEHYRFSYLPAHEVQARFVAREADQAYRRIRERLGAPAVEQIVADLTEASDHHLGIAGWKKMRMDLRPPKSEGLLRHVLYHETTHVLAAAAAEGQSREREAESRVFTEGLAEYVSYELLGERGARERVREDARRVAGLAHGRFRLRFYDLLDPETFLARHDEYLLYALGEVWVAALVDGCGPRTPGKVLSAFGQVAGPQRLSGAELWRHTLQRAGCDLDRVIGRYEQLLRRAEADAASLPIARGALIGEQDGMLLFEVAVDVATTAAATIESWPVTVRVRDTADSPPDQVIVRTVTVGRGRSQRVTLPTPPGAGRRIQFQVGARRQDDSPAFFSRWQSSTRVGE